MKIGICGTHSTGKTTLVEALRTEEYFKDYFFDINVTRWVREAGLPINENTSDASQEINLVKRIAHLNSFDNMICDRTIIDVLAYSTAGKHISKRSLEYQRKLLDLNAHKYDYIFYLPMDIAVVDDGVRAIDPEYRKQIDNLIIDSLHYLDNIRELNVYMVKGSVRERIQKILDIVKGESSESRRDFFQITKFR